MRAIRSIADQWHPPRDRVLWAPVLFGIGVGLYFLPLTEPPLWPAPLLILIFLVLSHAVRERRPFLAFPLFALALVAGGFFAAQVRSMSVHAPMLDRPSGVIRIDGRVLDISVPDDDGGGKSGKKRVVLAEPVIEDMPPESTPRLVRLSTRHVPDDVISGDRISVLAKLMPPSGPVVAGGFDYRRQAYFEGVGAVGFTLGKYEKLSGATATGGMEAWFNRWRQRIATRINAHLPAPESAVATALLAGERASIPDDINSDLRDSGLYHLLSISGLHVAIVCGAVFFVLRFVMALWPWFALHVPIKKIAAAAAIIAGLLYTGLAGAPIPTQRAMMTTGLMLLAVMLDRAALSLRTLALVALAVLVLRPESLVGPSFQLSFAAVAAMIVFYEGVGRRWSTEGRDASRIYKVLGYFAGIVLTTVLVSAVTLPIVLYHFGRVQVFGVVANALAIPLTSFVVMPAGMAAMLAMPFGAEGPFLQVVGYGVTLTLAIAKWVAHLPHAAFAWPSLPFGAYIMAVLGLLLLGLWRGPVRWLGVPLAIVAVALGVMAERPAVLLDGEGRTLAVRSDGWVAYPFKAPTAYLRSNWMALLGGSEVNDGKPLRDLPWQAGSVTLSCDDFACRIEDAGAHLSIVRERSAMAEDCQWAHVIVSLDKAVPAGLPCAARVIGFWDLRDAGGYAFIRAGQAWDALPAVPAAQRYWSVRPHARQ